MKSAYQLILLLFMFCIIHNPRCYNFIFLTKIHFFLQLNIGFIDFNFRLSIIILIWFETFKFFLKRFFWFCMYVLRIYSEGMYLKIRDYQISL